MLYPYHASSMFLTPVPLLALIAFSTYASGQILASHSGCTDPNTEGWTTAIGGVASVTPICSTAPCGRAWDVYDAIGGGGGVLNARAITAAQNCFAFTHGWRLSCRLRMHDTGPVNESIWVGYNTTSRRFDMWFSQNASNQTVIVLMTGLTTCVNILGPSFTATTSDPCSVPGFHTFELVYSPILAAARLFVDGTYTGINYSGHTLGLEQIPGIGWGAGSSCGSGSAAFNMVEFEIPCIADFNGDGTIDFFDYLDFADLFSSGAPAADFNCDGTIDFFDYLDFVDAFSIGC